MSTTDTLRVAATLLVVGCGLAGCEDEMDPGVPSAIDAGINPVPTRDDAAVADAASTAETGGEAGARALSCNDLPNPIYLQIGDTQEPHIKDLGKRLRDTTVADQRMTVVYVTTGSCTNIEAMYKGNQDHGEPQIHPLGRGESRLDAADGLPDLHDRSSGEGHRHRQLGAPRRRLHQRKPGAYRGPRAMR